MKFALRALALVLLLAIALAPGRVVPARADGIEVRSSTAQNQFPSGIKFTLQAISSSDISSARLRFRLLPEGPITTARTECDNGRSVICTATVGGPGGSLVVPKTEIRYTWEINDASGQRLLTDEAGVTYEDTRFQWKGLTSDIVTVFYYNGDEKTMQTVLQAARETIDKMSKLEGTQITFPVKIIYYASSRDLQQALGPGRDAGRGVILGEVASADTALVSREGFSLDIVRHEIAHVVTDHAAKNNPSLAIWINEGLSMYAQNEVDPDEKRTYDTAVAANKLFPITSMNSSSIRSNESGIFYPEARSIVTYLISTYGEPKFAEFIAALDRDTTDNALNKAFGLNANSLEDAWRKANGLQPAANSSAGSGPSINERPIPTIVPFGSTTAGSEATPASGAGQPSSRGKGGGLSLPIIAGAVVLVWLLGGSGFALLRSRSKRPKSP